MIPVNAAEQLAGMRLAGGWIVQNPITRHRLDTGGNFSVNYHLVNDDGRRAFLKALNLMWAATHPDPATALQMMTEAFNFERNVLAKCRDRRMDRVVRSVDDGQVVVPNVPSWGTVNYLIFEEADGGDVRGYLRTADQFDVSFSYRTLHQVAVALNQLHGAGIVHQDLKPSNVLVFEEQGVRKVADLGRASARDLAGPYDSLAVPGDPTYAPPELRYQYVPPDWDSRRQASDLYQLGSLLLFLFSDLSASAALYSELHPDHAPENWSGSFPDALPYLNDAFERVVEQLVPELPPHPKLRGRTTEAFRQLCAPDPTKRGHPSARRGVGSNYAVVRYVSLFDLLACTAESSLTGPGS